MSTEAQVREARAALDVLIAQVRATDPDEPALLIRVGRIAARVAAAEALDRDGDAANAGLFAAATLRQIAQDFPGLAMPTLDLLSETRAYREIARRALTA